MRVLTCRRRTPSRTAARRPPPGWLRPQRRRQTRRGPSAAQGRAGANGGRWWPCRPRRAHGRPSAARTLSLRFFMLGRSYCSTQWEREASGGRAVSDGDRAAGGATGACGRPRLAPRLGQGHGRRAGAHHRGRVLVLAPPRPGGARRVEPAAGHPAGGLCEPLHGGLCAGAARRARVGLLGGPGGDGRPGRGAGGARQRARGERDRGGAGVGACAPAGRATWPRFPPAAGTLQPPPPSHCKVPTSCETARPAPPAAAPSARSTGDADAATAAWQSKMLAALGE